MKTSPRQGRGPRPGVERLESRELLSTAAQVLPTSHRHVEPAASRAKAVTPILSNLGTPTTISTVPSNGDTNPYGVAFVPAGYRGKGVLQAGDLLVANYNDAAGQQGTGTTVDRITPGGAVSTFYQGPAGLGLDTALAVLKSGYVVVGNVPTADGTFATIGQGSLIVLDPAGKQVANLTDPALLDGPWDLAVDDRGRTASVFVSDVLSGTVSRFDVRQTNSAANPVAITRSVQVASGFAHRGDPAALVVGPGGLAFDPARDVLYVASQADDSIHVIRNAERARTDGGSGTVLVSDPAHLHGPIGLALAPNGDLIVANSDAVNADPNQPSELVEYTRAGQFVAERSLDAANGGAFGLAFSSARRGATLAAVDDVAATVEVFANA